MPPEQAEVGQLGPEGRERVRLRVEQAAGRRAGLMVGQEVGDALCEGPVLFGDGDRHAELLPVHPARMPTVSSSVTRMARRTARVPASDVTGAIGPPEVRP